MAVQIIHKKLYVCTCGCYKISEADLRSVAGSKRYLHRSAESGLRKTKYRPGGRDQRIHSQVRSSCTTQSAEPIHSPPICRPTDVVCGADMRVGEIRQYCKVREEPLIDAGGDGAAQSGWATGSADITLNEPSSYCTNRSL